MLLASAKCNAAFARSLRMVLATALAGGPGAAFGAELNYSYGYRAEFSDNVDRVAVDPRNDMVNTLFAGLSYQEHSRTVEARFEPTFEYIQYRKNTFADETRLNLDSSGIWTISPERFTWTAEDNVRQVLLDSTQPNTPTNNTTSNLFSTGPDFYLGSGSVNTLQLGGRFEDVHVSETTLDSQRGLYYTRLLHQTSPLTTLSLNFEAEKVEFEENISNVDFRRKDAFFRIERRTPFSNFAFDAGRTRIDRADGISIEDPHYQFSWFRQINTESNFQIIAEYGLTDTGGELASTAGAANTPNPPNPGGGTGTGPGSGTGTVSQNLVTADIFRARRGEISYGRQGSRARMNVRGFVRRLEFLASPENDREETGGDITFGLLFSGVSTFDMFYGRTRADYQNQTLVDNDTTVGLGLTRLITRNVSMTLAVTQDKRQSTDDTREFVDNRVIFSVTYNSGPIPRR